jgi:hypothetical protein
VSGTKLLVIDGAFNAIPGGPARADDLALVGDVPGLATILASGAEEPALAPAHLGSGLLSFHFERGLAGAADEDRDGHVDAAEAYRYARRWVVAESALQGQLQTPRASGLERGWTLR